MTVTNKKEALENAMSSFKFPKKYFIHIAGTGGKNIFCLASKTDSEMSSINTHSRFMTYDEFNAYLQGWYDAKRSKF